MTDLRGLLATAQCVLFDFDGPLCPLFARHPAEGVAERLAARMRELGAGPSEETGRDVGRDPLAVLRSAAARGASAAAMRELERFLSTEECEAAAKAEPTPFVLPLIRRLADSDHRMAVTTNNSPAAVIRFLEVWGVAGLPEKHIHGRTLDPGRLKPDPDCLHRALDSTGTAAADALMIGDSPDDVHAARAAGVPFLGYATDAEKYGKLRAAGAQVVLGSLKTLLLAVPATVRGGERGL
ncbi:HAD family hydrolase [Streptomyces sp. NPDC048560]|uniref:HAD family hydrolase n=1 Tax=Streptomyces sp. NPDC048560 TaxID=3155488 RepID=UPI00343EB469